MATRELSDHQAFPLLECPREIRDQIYAEVLLDFPTPSLREQLDCAMIGNTGPLLKRSGIGYALGRLKRTHKIKTNLLLTNRQVFNEGREIILRRGRLVQVTLFNVELALRLSSCEMCLIDARYGSLCMMTYECKCSWQTPGPSRISQTVSYRDWTLHRLTNSLIQLPVHRDQPDSSRPFEPSVFVLCERDIEPFCRAIMGETTFELHEPLSPATRQTLAFTTNFHEGHGTPDFLQRHQVHRRALQPFRSCLGGFQNVSLQGSSVGLSKVLAATALRDFSSQLVPDPFEILPEVFDMLDLSNKVYRIGSSDACELLEPLEKVIWRWTQAASKWDLWALARRKIKDPSRYFDIHMSAMYQLLVNIFLIFRDYGPWRRGVRFDPKGGIAGLYLLWPAVQMYEMCLALPKALGCPDWTPKQSLELLPLTHLAATLMPLRTIQADGEYILGLTLGYKAAGRIIELAPDNKLYQQWMEEYENWKSEAVQVEQFFVIDDEVMKKRGIMRWTGVHPGELVLSQQSE